MTFSDSKVVAFINEHFVPVWESVSPVRTVQFELGEGRSVKGTISGEIALYFCTPEGLVFDILPALQSPAATLEAMKEAASFARVKKDHPATSVRVFQEGRMKEIAALHLDESVKKQGLSELPKRDPNARYLFQQKSMEGLALRDQHINEAVDAATADMRMMMTSKVLMVMPTGSPLIVVEPGGKDYYRWEVAKRFLNVSSWSDMERTYSSENEEDRTALIPDRWKEELFVHILQQSLDEGEEVIYDSDSLKAIRIIQQ